MPIHRSNVRKVVTPWVQEPPPGTFSHCLVAGGQIYISGQHAGTQTGVIGEGNVFEQSREALRRIIVLVRAGGGMASDIVKLTVYLTDIERRAEVSAARREVFIEPFPCSTLVGVKALAGHELLVEIDAVAIIGAGAR